MECDIGEQEIALKMLQEAEDRLVKTSVRAKNRMYVYGKKQDGMRKRD
jgi:hypothetical protein